MAEEQVQDQKQEDQKQEQTKEAASDKRTEEALEILDILEDPQARLAFAKNLAIQAGLLTAETKKEETKVRRAAKEIIKSHLGDEYKHVAEKLGDALEEILNEKLGEVDGKFGELTKSQAERQFSADFDSFITSQEVTDEEAGLILKQLEVMSPNPKVPLKKFLSEQLELVRFRTGKSGDNKERLKRQADNFSKRAASTGTEASEKRVQPPKNPTVRDAVLAASRGERWE